MLCDRRDVRLEETIFRIDSTSSRHQFIQLRLGPILGAGAALCQDLLVFRSPNPTRPTATSLGIPFHRITINTSSIKDLFQVSNRWAPFPPKACLELQVEFTRNPCSTHRPNFQAPVYIHIQPYSSCRSLSHARLHCADRRLRTETRGKVHREVCGLGARLGIWILESESDSGWLTVVRRGCVCGRLMLEGIEHGI